MDSRRIVPSRGIDPLFLGAAAVALFMTLAADPWWSMTGSGNSNLITFQVSPYYLQTFTSVFSPSVPFGGTLGSLTRILMLFGSVALAASGLRPRAWWRELAVLFGLSTLSMVYLSFLLMYHSAVTSLLGAYGVVPPYSGSANLPTVILGLDLKSYPNPLVATGFGLPFYLGFVCAGLVGARLCIDLLKGRGRAPRKRGVEAIFTPKQ